MSERLRRFIAWWQIGCGVLGFLGLVLTALDWPSGAWQVARDYTGPLNLWAGAAFYWLCIAFGIRLLRGDRAGYVGSAVLQAVQVVGFAFVGGPHVLIQAGPKIALELGVGYAKVGIGFNSAFFLGTRISGLAWELSINLLALAWAVMLMRGVRSRPISTPEPAV